MSRNNNARRGWTHRRLGIGATNPSAVVLAETDAMLSLIGARETTPAPTAVADPLAAALLDYVYDLDLVADIATVDATPVGTELLRLTPTPPRRRLLTPKVMLPALSGGLAALVIGITLLVGGGNSSPTLTPSLSATAESRQLLQHAHTLLAAAANAAPAQQTQLYSEARADLRHVSRLLPLAPPPARPALRSQLQSLRKRVPPPPPARPAPHQGDGTTRGSSGEGSTADSMTVEPTRSRSQPKIPPVGTGSSGQRVEKPVATTVASNPPAGVGVTPPQSQQGRLPPSRNDQGPQQPEQRAPSSASQPPR